jgi:hypothetical protein
MMRTPGRVLEKMKNSDASCLYMPRNRGVPNFLSDDPSALAGYSDESVFLSEFSRIRRADGGHALVRALAAGFSLPLTNRACRWKIFVPVKAAYFLESAHILRKLERGYLSKVFIETSAVGGKHQAPRGLSHVTKAVVRPSQRVAHFTAVERRPGGSVEELEFTFDDGEDFVLTEVTMWRRSTSWRRGLDTDN